MPAVGTARGPVAVGLVVNDGDEIEGDAPDVIEADEDAPD